MNLSQAVQEELHNSQLLSEAINTGIANISSVARYIKPDLEKKLGESLSDAAIIMSIKRLPLGEGELLDRSIRSFMTKLGDITVRSDLSDHTYANSPTLPDAQQRLLAFIKEDAALFHSTCKGVHETTLVCSATLNNHIDLIFQDEKLTSQRNELAAVSVNLPPANLDTHGIYYVILKQLAWKGINLVEMLSTSHEITLIVAASDVEEVFSLILDLKRS